MAEDRLFDLLEKYVENDLSSAERDEFEGLLKDSPENRRRFWGYLHQHALLRKLMARAQGRTLALAPRAKRTGWIAAAAACALIVAGAILFRPQPPPEPAPKIAVKRPAIAPVEPVRVPSEVTPAPVDRTPPLPAPRPEEPSPKPPPPPTEERPRPEPEKPKPAEPRPPLEEPKPPAPAPVRETIPAVAQVERVLGEVQLASGGRLRAGQDLLPGQGFNVGPRDSLAVLKYTDGTRIEIGPASRVRDLRDESGKKLTLERGLLSADVARQPAARPLVISTPHAEARVGGTRLVLWALPESSRLEVREGRVRVSRREDNAAVEVGADQQAVVAKGTPLSAKPARVTDDLVALYRLDAGPVDVIRDVSGFGPPLDLDLRTPKGAAWKPEGLALQSYSQIGSHGPARKIVDACRKSREITLEAWVVPDKASFKYAGYLMLLGEWNAPNAALLQGVSTPASGSYSAAPSGLSTPKNFVDSRPTHLVYVRAAGGQERLYVNGVPRAAGLRPGDFAAWNDDARLILGLEWLGEYRLAAIYSRALKESEVIRNFKLGTE